MNITIDHSLRHYNQKVLILIVIKRERCSVKRGKVKPPGELAPQYPQEPQLPSE